ncbi:MAG: hypothetical protein LBC21_04510, partial [Oscillospiraceae bacterium]|nr:hypothetical protein [Oscillospiraceae bacterium]
MEYLDLENIDSLLHDNAGVKHYFSPALGSASAATAPDEKELAAKAREKEQKAKAKVRASALAQFAGAEEGAVRETARLRETVAGIGAKAKVAATEQNARRMADKLADEYGVRTSKQREKLLGHIDAIRAIVRGESPDFGKMDALARDAAQLALRRHFPAADSPRMSPVETAEANAAHEIATRELANEILATFADGRRVEAPGHAPAGGGEPKLSDPYMALLETFGAYPQGEKAARIFPVPKNTDPDDKDGFVRRGARNAAEAAATPDETANRIEEAIVEGLFTDTREAQAKLMENAWSRVTPYALDAQMGRLDAIFDERSEKQKPLSSQELADFFELYKQLNAAGRYGDAVNVMAKLAMFGTWAGRSVSAWRILKALGPGGELAKLDAVLRKLNKTDGTDYEIPEDIRAAVLGDAERGAPPLDMDDGDAIAEIEAKFVDWLAARRPATRREKFRKWRYVAMLTNPVTWGRNFTGNALMSALNAASKPLERAMQRALLPQGERTATTSRATKETRAYAESSYKEMSDILRGDDPADLSARVRAKRQQFKNKLARAMDELTDAAMNGVPASEKSKVKKALSLLSDSKFLKIYYTNALSNYITAQGIDVVKANDSLELVSQLDKAKQYAMDEALRLTYRQSNKFSKGYNKLMSAFFSGAGESGFSDELRMMLLGGALPYAKVPSNILSTSLNLTPAGLLYDVARVSRQAWAAKRGKDLPPNARAIAISKLAQSVTGGAILAGLGIFGSLMGVIRIKLPDDDKGDSDYQSFRRGYSLEAFGLSIPLGWAAPLSVPLFLGAAAAEAVQGKLSKLGGDDSPWGVAGTVLAGMADPLFEMSMVKGVNDLLQGIRRSANGSTLAIGLAASMMESYYTQAWPSLAGRLASVFDAAQRRTSANPDNELPDGPERSLLAMAHRVPGVRNMLL